MKLTLRPEWRLWPLTSFLGILDLKSGVTIALLFALLNKVAGVYGLIAVLTGAGGSFAQLSLYIYSAVGLVALAWGLKVVKAEDPRKSLYFAHLFFADHIFSTAWTVFFAIIWWVYTPHDGRRQANSAAQEEMMKHGVGHNMTDEEREAAALMIWNHEKGSAAAVIIISWLFKIYLAALLYSYAVHLRKGSYRTLPLSRPSPNTYSTALPSAAYDTSLAGEDEEAEEFYRAPHRTPQAGGSVSSFTEFVAAPGRSRKFKAGGKSLSGKPNGHSALNESITNDTLFADDEGSSRGHSRLGTEDRNGSASPEINGQRSWS